MINEYSEAVSETLEVLKFMEDELLNKIPLEVIRKLKQHRSPSYINKFNDAIEINFDQLSGKTKDILAVLYRDYIADEEEKIEFDKLLDENERKGDGENYTIKKFEKKETNTFLPVAIEKKNFIQKIFEKIFKINKKIWRENSHRREIKYMEQRISEILKEEIQNSKYPVVGAKYNNEYKNLDDFVNPDGKIELITINSKEGMKIYRRTLTYIMGKAFWRTYPQAHITVDYQLSNAMYCTIDNMEVTNEMLENVKAKMREIIDQDLKIEKRTMSWEEAEQFFAENNTSKGRLQLDLEEKQEINMCFCADYFNYLYETIATHTGVTEIFDLQKYSEGFILRYPSTQNVKILPEFKETKK